MFMTIILFLFIFIYWFGQCIGNRFHYLYHAISDEHEDDEENYFLSQKCIQDIGKLYSEYWDNLWPTEILMQGQLFLKAFEGVSHKWIIWLKAFDIMLQKFWSSQTFWYEDARCTQLLIRKDTSVCWGNCSIQFHHLLTLSPTQAFSRTVILMQMFFLHQGHACLL